MKKFQILDKEGNALSLKQLDAEAANFWNKEVDSKHYSYPFHKIIAHKKASFEQRMKIDMQNNMYIQFNWYDVIGWNIANQGTHTDGWNNVVYTMVAENLGSALLGDDYTLPTFHNVGHVRMHLSSKVEGRIEDVLRFYEPFVDLIRHWESKGYTPKQISE